MIPPHSDDRAFVLDSDVGRTRALFCTSTLDLARVLGDVDFKFAPSSARAAVAWGTSTGPGCMSRWWVTLVARVLPVTQRGRYSAEYNSELVELPLWKRPAYALCVLASSWELHRALKEAGHTPDRDVGRRAER